jgi:amino acid transporter
VVAGLFAVHWHSLGQANMPSVNTIGKAALLLLFAFAGFENSPALAGEYENPKRDIPFAILTMILFVTSLYVLVQLVAVGTFPGLANSKTPLADSAFQFLGAGGAVMMTIAAVFSIGGNVSNTPLIGPRYLYALAKDGYGPRLFAKIHPAYRTPAAAIILQTFIALLLALSGSFVELALLSIIARLITYIGTAAAVPVLRKKFGVSEQTFKLPGGWLIPALGLLICLVFLASTTRFNLMVGAIGLVVGALIYFFWSDKSVNEHQMETID